MARQSVDPKLRRNILDARRMIQEAEKSDCNEAETRRRIERIFEQIMGYNALEHLSREHAIRGAGETEHVDFAVQVESGEDARPEIMVEIKRVCVGLAPKHLRQISSYAINAGCEWILLTNSKEWKLYHISFGQPPVTKLIQAWNILTDEVSLLAQHFGLVSLKSVKKGTLTELWRKANILHPRNLLEAMLSQGAIMAVRRELRRSSGVLLSPEDVLSGIRRLLNEAALSELENVQISLLKGKRHTTAKKNKVTPKKETAEEPPANSKDQEQVRATGANSDQPPVA